MHPDTAGRLDVRDGEILRLTSPHGTIEAPVFVYAGIRPDVWRCRSALATPSTAPMPRVAASTRSISWVRSTGRVPALPVHSGNCGRRPGATRSWPRSPGNPRQLGRGIAEGVSLDAARKGLTVEQAYIAAGRGKHEVNTEQELEAVKGWSEGQEQATRYGNYEGDHPPLGHGDRPGASAPAARRASPRATPRTTFPRWAKSEIHKGREMTWIRIERYWEGGEEPGEPSIGPVRSHALSALRQRAL